MANFEDVYQYSFGVTSVAASEGCYLQTRPFQAHATGTLRTKRLVFFVICLNLYLFCAIKCHKLLYLSYCVPE